jgi:DNA-binding NarL/FixJ family response regulator
MTATAHHNPTPVPRTATALRTSKAQAAADGLLDALGTASDEGTPSTRAVLTMQQRVILSLVAQGQPNKRIASELGIAERTVELHVTGLLDKLCARNRTHLLVVARQHDLV